MAGAGRCSQWPRSSTCMPFARRLLGWSFFPLRRLAALGNGLGRGLRRVLVLRLEFRLGVPLVLTAILGCLMLARLRVVKRQVAALALRSLIALRFRLLAILGRAMTARLRRLLSFAAFPGRQAMVRLRLFPRVPILGCLMMPWVRLVARMMAKLRRAILMLLPVAMTLVLVAIPGRVTLAVSPFRHAMALAGLRTMRGRDMAPRDRVMVPSGGRRSEIGERRRRRRDGGRRR